MKMAQISKTSQSSHQCVLRANRRFCYLIFLRRSDCLNEIALAWAVEKTWSTVLRIGKLVPLPKQKGPNEKKCTLSHNLELVFYLPLLSFKYRRISSNNHQCILLLSLFVSLRSFIMRYLSTFQQKKLFWDIKSVPTKSKYPLKTSCCEVV